MLVVLCILIFPFAVFASELIKKVVTINIVCLMLIAFGVYSVMRGIMEMKDRDTQYKLISGTIISAIGVGFTVLLIQMVCGLVVLALPSALSFMLYER